MSVEVLCADGVVRRATFTAPADTFFSRPARVSAKGKTVSGFAWTRDGGGYGFTGTGKNRDAVGLWPEQSRSEANG